MSRMTYTVDQRTAALVEVERGGGDIIRASLKTGIPERTLYTWRRRFYAENKRQQSPLPPSPIPMPALDGDLESLTYVRQKIMSELVRLAATFQEDTTFASLQQRVIILSQLIDRLIKLDYHLDPYHPGGMYQLPDAEVVPFRFGYHAEKAGDENEINDDNVDGQSDECSETTTEPSPSPPSIFA